MLAKMLARATCVAAFLSSCASQNAHEDSDAPTEPSFGGSTVDATSTEAKPDATGGSRSGTRTDSVQIPASTGGASATGPGVGMSAEQTDNGLFTISSTQATSTLSDPATSCAGWADEPKLATSVVEFIVDISGSMGDTTSSTRGQTKWSVTRRALLDAISQLPPELAVGMSFYPHVDGLLSIAARPESACIDTSSNIAIAPLDDMHLAELAFSVDMMEFFVEGATPTHDAYDVGLAAIRATTSPGQKYLVLITDGQPTLSKGCVGTGRTCPPEPTQPIIDAIATAFANDQVKTFIVGSPGSEINECSDNDLRAWLSAAARAGGTAATSCSDQAASYCHFDLSQATDFGAALGSALGTIAKSVVSCDYAVPSVSAGKVIDTTRVNMIYDDGAGGYSLVLPSESAVCQKGWQFTDASLSGIHVCPQTCALLQSNPQAKISLVFGCTQEQIQTPLL